MEKVASNLTSVITPKREHTHFQWQAKIKVVVNQLISG